MLNKHKPYLTMQRHWSILLSLLLCIFQACGEKVEVSEREPSIADFERRAVVPSIPMPEGIHVTHRVRSGESFATLFREYGVEAPVDGLLDLLKAERKDFAFEKGEKVEISLEASGELDSLLFISPESDLLLSKNESDEFAASTIEYKKEEKERIAVASVQTSFGGAATRSGMSYRVVDEVVDLFASRFSFHKDFRKGDRFVVIYKDAIREDGLDLHETEILAALIEVKGKPHVAIRYVGEDGEARYFDDKGELIGEAFLRYPLKFSRISSYYSKSRLHPILKRRRPHLGIDFAAPSGTPIRSVADGVITKAGRSGGAGIMLKVKHSDKYATAYLHLSKIAKGIKRSKKVERGQVIGYVGSTGLSTGPHLDYRFYVNGKSVDPLKVDLPKVELLDEGTKVNERFLRRVMYTLEHYRSVELSDFYRGQ